MKNIRIYLLKICRTVFIVSLLLMIKCTQPETNNDSENVYKILFLHHSTGNVIWKGKPKGMDVIKNILTPVNEVPEWFRAYNEKNGTAYLIEDRIFPKTEPYGWANYPYDYYNIWVKNGDDDSYMEEPTLITLTKDYDLIIFKHCFPVSQVEPDVGRPNINSDIKRVENYKLQYNALKEKLHEFDDTKFLLWTSAALVESKTNPKQAEGSQSFVNWVKNEWDETGDNIYLWDFYALETGGGLYLKNENARSKNDSHPSKDFAAIAAPLFCKRIIDVIENEGHATFLSGIKK